MLMRVYFALKLLCSTCPPCVPARAIEPEALVAASLEQHLEGFKQFSVAATAGLSGSEMDQLWSGVSGKEGLLPQVLQHAGILD